MNKQRIAQPGALGKMKTAFRIVQQAHAGQYRKGSEREPFYNHPRRVCKAYLRFRHRTLEGALAALCHDLVEDTRMEPEDIERLFGASVRCLVENLTKPDGVSHLDYRRNFEGWTLECKKVKVCDIEDNILGSRSIPDARRRDMMVKWDRYLEALNPGAGTGAPEREEYRLKWEQVRNLLEREWNAPCRTGSTL